MEVGYYYSISGAPNAKVNGDYVASGRKGTFQQRGGVHVLEQHVTDQWGIRTSDGLTDFLFLTESRGDAPDCSSWLMLHFGRYEVCPSMGIEEFFLMSEGEPFLSMQ
jgi:hypothetical protein